MAEPWFKDGLRFGCTRCGNCCTGEPGFVWVDDGEIAALAEFLGLPADEVFALHTRRGSRGRTVREKPNGDCLYFERGVGCTVYAVRPRQCRTWPFWESNIRTPEAWAETARGCPGTGVGELIPVEEIVVRRDVIRL